MMSQSHSYGTSSYVTLPDGRKLHYMSKGTGSPTVVFESGMGCSRSQWGLVQPLIGEQTRAVVYDRAGAGRSQQDREPRTLARLAGDLGSLLDHLGPGPFILVGHSWGGPVIRTVASSDPSRIRALVLVDPSDENCGIYFAPSTAKSFAVMRAILPFMARIGLYKLTNGKVGQVQPADVVEDHLREDFTVHAARASNAESLTFIDDLARMRTEPPTLGPLPVSVISGTFIARAERKMRPAIIAAHQRTVQSLDNGRWVEAPHSGHMINFTDPDIIVDEINRYLHE
ncbi:alpha/beta hydrolase [Paenibacillus sp. MY03]|uniref:alpha/beta fold hydrolase n=1 Tax=Paenibacillus sp. MY03 TaxID=302980 RepID=UPI000B3CB547|nr:alpha/beta hydrolase [Paenibacillus sp. MY03]OUS75748.1 alpha/beta hydrolase [Paenibacillus sp. MY03]